MAGLTGLATTAWLALTPQRAWLLERLGCRLSRLRRLWPDFRACCRRDAGLSARLGARTHMRAHSGGSCDSDMRAALRHGRAVHTACEACAGHIGDPRRGHRRRRHPSRGGPGRAIAVAKAVGGRGIAVALAIGGRRIAVAVAVGGPVVPRAPPRQISRIVVPVPPATAPSYAVGSPVNRPSRHRAV